MLHKNALIYNVPSNTMHICIRRWWEVEVYHILNSWSKTHTSITQPVWQHTHLPWKSIPRATPYSLSRFLFCPVIFISLVPWQLWWWFRGCGRATISVQDVGDWGISLSSNGEIFTSYGTEEAVQPYLESVLVFVVFVRMPLGASHMLPVSASVLKLCCMLLDCCCCFSKKG